MAGKRGLHRTCSLKEECWARAAKSFFAKYEEEYKSEHPDEMRILAGVSLPDHVNNNALCKSYMEQRRVVRMCHYSFELLVSFLHRQDAMFLLAVLNQHFHFECMGPLARQNGRSGHTSQRN